MIPVWSRWLIASLIGAVLLPFVVLICSLAMAENIPATWIVGMIAGLLLFGWLFYKSLAKRAPALSQWLEPICEGQSNWVHAVPEKWIGITIVLAAGASLLLELAVIRWQAGLFEFFSFYKNFAMLSCFAGLGIGYVLSNKKQIPLVCVIPLLVVQQLMLTILRHAFDIRWVRSLRALPVQEQLNMGMSDQSTLPEMTALYFAIAVVIVLTMLAFVPVGQLCGQLMSRMSTVRAYGANLLGSLLGILTMTGLSVLQTSPVIWFGLVYMGALLASLYDKRAAAISACASLVGIAVLAWPVEFGYERVYSPYQLVERGPGDHGWSELRAGCLYYQRVMDLSKAVREAYNDDSLRKRGQYYDFPFTVKQAPENVLVFGAGMGNDVAAALRNGAKHVDAVEIDPCIAAWGKRYHPEQPYSDPRVHLVVNDARAFLRQTKNKYDLVLFGLLDSHSLSGHASSLRVDSYIYTLESFKEARAHLKPDGVLSLAFASTSADLMVKIYRMMTQAFDGKAPVCIGTNYDESFTYLQNQKGDLQAPQNLEASSLKDLAPTLAQATGAQVDCSTDDWPFFYMPRRVWPVSYLPMLALLMMMCGAVSRTLGASPGRFSGSNLQYFLLGAGFMLVEAKAITELGLHFGNTWGITAIVIGAVILLGFLGNLLVQYKRIGDNPPVAYSLVLLTLGVGYWLALSGGMPSTVEGKIGAVAILVGPIMFSGICFSLLISREKDISRAMCWNLLGAMFGGVVEYCAMYTGYRALYLLALAIYGTAFGVYLLSKRPATTEQTEVSIAS